MVDSIQNSVYFWYSGPTDRTGQSLVSKFSAKGGKTKPNDPSVKVVVGWGAKTREPVGLGNAKTLNHPDKIRLNRNKYNALVKMKEAGVSVADFAKINEPLTGEVKLPLIARTNYHQGGKGFWNCPTTSHVVSARHEGADYVQNLIEIADEYRLHTFGDSVIYAVKKVQRSAAEMEEAFVRQELQRQKELAEKNGNPFDEATAELMLKRMGKKFAQNGADTLVRSNRLGWKFSRVKTMPEGMEAEAVKAVKAIGLDFGAVDCCIDVNGKVFIIEVNTAPGLEGSSLEAWTEALKNKLSDMLTPPAPKKSVWSMPSLTPGQTQAYVSNTTQPKSTEKKANLSSKLQLLQQLLAEADSDEDVAALSRMAAKTFK